MQQVNVEALIEQIKAELRAEMIRPRYENPHWSEIKQLILESFPNLPTYGHYQIINGLSPVVRYMFGLNQIKHINAEQAKAVKEAVKLLIVAARKNAERQILKNVEGGNTP
jgi:hypothetical protein